MLKKRTPVLTSVVTILFFLIVCLSASAYIKRTSMLAIAASLSAIFLFYSKLQKQVKLPLIATSLFVLIDGISCFYAVNGRLALLEFLKVLVSFCYALLLLSFCKEKGRTIPIILSGTAALESLISIDLISTRLISTPILNFLGQYSSVYRDLPGIEPGVRINSMFVNPNVFAGTIGIGLLLSLGLAASAQSNKERAIHLVCLFISSLAFVLAFSMGALLAIAVAFPAYLLLEIKGRRIRLLILMLETLVITLLAAFPISLTSFHAWNGIQPVPMVCLVLGAVCLCLFDRFVATQLIKKASGHTKSLLSFAVALAAFFAVFLIAACNWTGSIVLHPNETLRRSAYPAPGVYSLSAESDGTPQITIESQNRADTTMHTSTLLYQGELASVTFTVPEDSIIVWFNISAADETNLTRVTFENETGSVRLPLKYRLIPGFIANRMQGLRANQNAIQRFSFFEDGLKLFCRSPIVGLGLGSFESELRSVQTFYYSTRYAHNHYIQALEDTGIIGFLLFVGMLAAMAAAVWFSRQQGVLLAPALGAALIFLAGHVLTEMVFSTYVYLPMAFALFAVINDCCGEAIPIPERFRTDRIRGFILLGWAALLVVFAIFLSCHVVAQNMSGQMTFEAYEEAARLDAFEGSKHKLSYILKSIDNEVDDETRQKADRYAASLEKCNAHSTPFYLTEYYMETGRPAQAFEMAQKYAAHMAASSNAWQELFNLLERYETDTPLYREGISALAQMREEWNAQNLGTITLSAENEAFLARMQEAT